MKEHYHNGNHIYVIECHKLNKHLNPTPYNPSANNFAIYNNKDTKLQVVLDRLGNASA